jgi:xanthine dehydrogenase accessory factor
MTLRGFLAEKQDVVHVRLVHVQGSSPREAGAEMFVSPDAMHGTIGGGQLEYMALDHARQMLARGEDHTVMNVPLGPEIGQCCGGRVEIALTVMTAATRLTAIQADDTARDMQPEVLIFGAGHVGRALAQVLQTMPVRTRVTDSREKELSRAVAVNKCLTPLPESQFRTASYGAAFVITTHDHALDFMLAAEALKRSDAAYVGMIGSATKRARFKSWAQEYARGADPNRLICPMGASGLGDKRPEVIALHIAAEVMQVLNAPKNIRQRMEKSI